MFKCNKIFFFTAFGIIFGVFAIDVGPWLKNNSWPLESYDPFTPTNDDLQFLEQYLKNKKVLIIGEQTHGTHEFHEMKHRIMSFLFEKMNFNVWVLEDGWPEVQDIDKWIQTGNGKVNNAFHNLLFNWQTEENLNNIYWMREFNSKKGHNSQSRAIFAGMDMQKPKLNIDQVLSFVSKYAQSSLTYIQSLLACYVPYVIGFSYCSLSQPQQKDCNRAIHEMFSYVESNQQEWTNSSSLEKYALTLFASNLIVQANHLVSLYCKYAVDQNATDYINYRDEQMAHNAKRIFDFLGPDTKMVIYTHNMHAATSHFMATVNGVSFPMIPFGYHIKQYFGDQMSSVAQFTYQGYFTAANVSSGEISQFKIPKIPNTYSYYLHQGNPLYLLDLQQRSPHNWLVGPLNELMVGGGYSEQDEKNFVLPLYLPQMYDAALFVDKTTATKLLY